jgi:hypothetical protein
MIFLLDSVTLLWQILQIWEAASRAVRLGPPNVMPAAIPDIPALPYRHASAGWHLPDQPDSLLDPSLRWGDG